MIEELSRIKFYGVTDMSTGQSLVESEVMLKKFDPSLPLVDINDVLELYNVVELFDSDARLTSWSEKDYEILKKRVKSVKSALSRFSSTLSNENILEEFNKVEINYVEDFWSFFAYYKLHSKITTEVFGSLLACNLRNIHLVLNHKSIVDAYSDTISDTLLKSAVNAEILISEYLSYQDPNFQSTFSLPRSFSIEKREHLVNMYISSDNANLNYVKLLFDSRDNTNLPLSIKTKLAAQKKYDALVHKIFTPEFSHGMEFSFEISFDPDCDKPIKDSDYSNGKRVIIYGRQWIENNLDFPTLWNNFIYMFQFVDMKIRSQFVSNPVRQSIFERIIGPHGKSTYFLGTNEQFANKMYSTMLLSYQHILELHDISIESLISWFFGNYLPNEFQVHGFSFNQPSRGVTDLEKCKLLATELDAVLKQFDLYAREGELNRELFEFNSEQMQIKNICSMIPNKYFYSASNDCKTCIHYMFSNQTSLSYTEKHRTKYKTFSELIRKENVTKSDISSRNIPLVDFLIEKKCIKLDDKLNIRFCEDRAAILHDMYLNQYCCNSYLYSLKSTVNEMYESGDIRFTSTLFSEPEQDYLRYMLKSDFSNGNDLRNKYIHGNYPSSINQQNNDYLEFLKIFILTVIKINEEFCLREDLANMQANQFES